METINDIVNEMREKTAKSKDEAWYDKERWAELCDRIEEAAKHGVGNAAKMREAIEAVVKVGYPHNFQREAPHIRGYCYEITAAIKKCFAALGAPARNCDLLANAHEALATIHNDRGYVQNPIEERELTVKWLLAEAKGGAK